MIAPPGMRTIVGRAARPAVALALLLVAPLHAHDFERTQVTLTFARDGSFVLDVANDAAWLEHRLIPFRGADARAAKPSFADRVVLFVDGHEVRPTSVEFAGGPPPLATYRMRGRVGLNSAPGEGTTFWLELEDAGSGVIS